MGCSVLGKVAAIRRMPSPQPSPTGEGADYSKFCGCRRFEKQLGFTTVDAGRLKNKKQPVQPVFLAEPLIPTAARPLSPWERVRERATSRKACIWAVVCWERLLQFGECPLPSPPPREREQIAADSSVTGRLKKDARNINSGNFSGSLYRKADGTNAASVFSDGL